jgi:hypothetical protein
MNMKWNWGTWIVISFILFAAGTFAMVYISMSSSVDLVADDYYEKELKYQDHIDLVKGTNALDKQVSTAFTGGVLQITFPALGQRTDYAGSIHFFRPSDKRGDFTLPVAVDTAFTQTFPKELFAQGLWRVKITWNVAGKQYYSEIPVTAQ